MKMVTYKQIIGHFIQLKRTNENCLLTAEELEAECKRLFLKHSNDWDVINNRWTRKDLIKRLE